MFCAADECTCCFGMRGNVDCSTDNRIGLGDITTLISYVYIAPIPLCCPESADVNGDGTEPNLTDITRLIDYVYVSGREPAPCP